MAPKSEEEESQTPYPVHSDQEIDKQSYNEEDLEENENPSGESDSDDDTLRSDTESQYTVPSPMVTDFTIKMNQPSQNPRPSGSKMVDKMGKPSNGGRPLDKKKSPITRIWEVNHELETVEGMQKFRNETGQDPCENSRAFHEFMKKHLSINVTRDQLVDKCRRLKNRYLRKAAKGDNPVFSNPDLKKLFELSKKEWGGVRLAAAVSSVKGRKRKGLRSVSVNDLISKECSGDKRAKKSVEAEKSMALAKVTGKKVVVEGGCDGLKGDQGGFWDKFPRFKEVLEKENLGYFSEGGKRVMDFQLSKIGAEKAGEMEKKWKEFQEREAELFLFKLKLVAEQTELMLDAVRAAKQ